MRESDLSGQLQRIVTRDGTDLVELLRPPLSTGQRNLAIAGSRRQAASHLTRKGDTMDTIVWQRIEAAIVFVAAIALFAYLDHSLAWWLAVILFFLPDVSFAGYALGPKAGAVVYNVVHVYALGMVLLAVGFAIGSGPVAALGALWMGHAGFDRMLGFGLKSPEGFKITHLGHIG
jgi:hypothetical protein